VLKQLRDEYEAAFECEWESTPWGETWSEVLKRANEADRAYEEATHALRGLRDAVGAALRALREFRGHPQKTIDADDFVGRTLPEHGLARLFAGPQPLLLQVDAHAAHILSLVEQKPSAGFTKNANVLRQLQAVTSGAPSPAFDAYHKELFALLLDRNMKRTVLRGRNGTILDSDVSAYLPGPPPRTLKGSEWRRAYLTEILDIYALGPDPDGQTDEDGRLPMLRPTDRMIAVVSLLAGGLDVSTEAALGKGTAWLIAAERKAIALSRRRRAFITGVEADLSRSRQQGPVRTTKTPRSR
jgi:hypothetical protein